MKILHSNLGMRLHPAFFFFLKKKRPHQGRQAKNFPGGAKKGRKYQKDRKLAVLSLPGGRATEKIPKNSTIKPLPIISVSCMKIHGGHGPPAFRCRRPCALQL